ncbi:hypothetical protein SAMN05444579_105363, partial [Delftia tsuruhatensis]
NIGVFMDTAAIGTAYIGQAAIGTLQIAGGSVTSMTSDLVTSPFTLAPGETRTICNIWIDNPASGASGVVLIGMAHFMPNGGAGAIGLTISRGGNALRFAGTSAAAGFQQSALISGFDAGPPPGVTVYSLQIQNLEGSTLQVFSANLVGTGGRR